MALGIWINVGGRYESFQNKGISHFLEHLLFKGTKKYSCRMIKESIEGVGGSLNGFTAEELTCYLVKMPSRYLNLALDVLSSMVLNPTLSEKEIDKERTVILEEIKMYKDQPQSYIYDLLDELLWPAQPLGLPIIGSEESVAKINRGSLSLFKEEYYTASNIVVSITGSFDHDKLIDSAENIFSSRKRSGKNDFIKVNEEQFSAQIKLLEKPTEQMHMALGFHGFKRDHPLKYALSLLNIILGANMSSRLFNEVREKRGLAYEIGTQIKRFQDTGAFIVHAGIDNQKLPAAIELILKELAKAKDKLVSEGELLRAKEFQLGQLMLGLEDTLDHMLWIGESTTTLDKTYSLDEVIKEVKKVSKDDVRQAARAIFNENKINLALIGPVRDCEEKIKNSLHFK